MSFNQDKFWISEEGYKESEELVNSSSNEFFNLPILNEVASDAEDSAAKAPSSRRDFLKYLGFSVGAATIAASCDAPVRRAIPYVKKPDSIVPGVATYYASTFVKSGDFCPVLVKTREGRPIKIEGNMLSPLTGGGTTARVQASVLSLYDTSRYKNPGKVEGAEVVEMSWDDVDRDIKSQLNAGTNIRIVSHSIISPGAKAAINKFKEAYPNTVHCTYDPYSSSALVSVHEQMTGERGVPAYDFSKADTIVSIGADFLGTWVAPAVFSNQYAKRRKVDPKHPELNYLISVESNMSLTGSNADDRIQIRPSEQGVFIASLYNELARRNGRTSVGASGASEAILEGAKAVAEQLAKSKSTLIVSDSNNKFEQELIASINLMLGNYGRSISSGTYYTRQGKDAELAQLLRDIKSGSVGAILFVDEANPAYDTPYGNELKEALSSVPLRVSMAYEPNETSALCSHVCPTNHYLESWSDAQPNTTTYSLIQPTIPRLFNTRLYAESLLAWAGVDTSAGYVEHLKEEWKGLFAQQNKFATFQAFWDASLHDGVVNMEAAGGASAPTTIQLSSGSVTQPSSSELELKLFEPIGVGCGQYANNPWLQEMPDPITRVVWDNNIQVPIKWEGGNNFVVLNNFDKDGQLASVSMGDKSVTLPIVKQFGQTSHAISIALGYGREVCGAAGRNIGGRFTDWLSTDAEGNVQYFATNVSLSGAKGKDKTFASVQHHHTLGVTGEVKGGKIENVDEKTAMTIRIGDLTNFQGGLTDRTIIRQSNLNELEESVAHLAHEREHIAHLNETSIYDGHDEKYDRGHHWGLAVDLTACTGCGACQVACMAENNVPVVGKKEVHRHHEMTWLRIDRYYYGDANNPNVVYQPMMCQHCDNAPCENVCPVAATPHSSEGLNQMTYNRCVGTRYCANNCPYKVRRFNWLDYTTADTFFSNENNTLNTDEAPFYSSNLVRMVLNPDVTVRSRGVIEKCSMCVQRIQEGKLRAKTENRPLRDGDIKVACQTACPTGGIIFGDLNDKDSELVKRWNSDTNYFVLEEVNVLPSVGYQMKVTNKHLSELHVHHGQEKGGDAHTHMEHGDDHGHDDGHGNHDEPAQEGHH